MDAHRRAALVASARARHAALASARALDALPDEQASDVEGDWVRAPQHDRYDRSLLAGLPVVRLVPGRPGMYRRADDNEPGGFLAVDVTSLVELWWSQCNKSGNHCMKRSEVRRVS